MPRNSGASRHALVAQRAAALVNITLASDITLVSRALDRAIGTAQTQRALDGQHDKDLRPGDVIAFRLRGRQRLLAVVTSRSGARVRFVYRFAGQGRLGALHLRQPNRRRLPGERSVSNTYLRPVRVGEPATTPRLAGQLLIGRIAL